MYKKSLLFLTCFSLFSCHEKSTLSVKEVEALLENSPPIILNDGKVRLAGIEEFYLGQSEKEAKAFLKVRCKKPLELGPSWKRANTFFLGCLLPDDQHLYSFRIGFHPKLDNQVFTLEVKRSNLSADLIRAQFYKYLELPFEDISKVGALRMRSKEHNLFASWDDGIKGPSHIIVGLNPDNIK